MSNRSRAQQERRSRERAASEAMAAAASVPDDAQVEFEPDPETPIDTAPAGEAQRRDDDDAPQLNFVRGNKERESAMDELVRARQESATPEPEPEGEAEPTVQAEATPELAPAPAPEPEMITAKVDGEEFQVPKSEVEEYGGLRAYQMHKAAEKRLAAAKEAERRIAELLKTADTQVRQPAQPVEPPRKPEDIIRDAVAKIQIATPEEGAAALANVLQTLIPKAPDPQQISFQTLMLMRATEAEDRFVKENADLVENPLLKQLVISEKQRRLAEYQSKKQLPPDWHQFYTAIGSEIRAAIGRPATTPVPAAQTPSQPTSGSAATDAQAARVQRKASITALPTASARATMPEEQKPPTRAELLDQMRKARGQPV